MDEIQNLFHKMSQKPNKHEPFTLNQIAFNLFGVGNATNAAKVGHLIAENPYYFQSVSTYKVRIKWDEVYKVYPEPGKEEKFQGTLREGLLLALKQEIKHSSYYWKKNPLLVHGLKPLPGEHLVFDGSIFEEDGNSATPPQEGMKVKIHPRNIHGFINFDFHLSAVLLVYSPLDQKVVVEFETIPDHHFSTIAAIVPDTEYLLHALKNFVHLVEEPGLARSLVGNHVEEVATADSSLEALDDPHQSLFIQDAAKHSITFLWGPPGTGKTFTLAALAAQLALRGERILISSISNAAVDEIADDLHERLMMTREGRRLLQDAKVLRYGFPGPKVLQHERLFPHQHQMQALRQRLLELLQAFKREKDIHAKAKIQQETIEVKDRLRKILKECFNSARVMLTTVAQTSICESLLESYPFDTAIFDEASMMNLLHILPGISRTTKRIIVAGDPRQLGPVVISNAPAAKEFLHQSLFESTLTTVLRKSRAFKLAHQRRMHPSIGRLVSKHFYNDALESSAAAGSLSLPYLNDKRRYVVVEVADASVEKTKGGSRRNERNARVVMALMQQIIPSAGQSSIGIITPYRAQVALLRGLLAEAEKTHRLKYENVRVGTIHAFQGGESDIIIWDLERLPKVLS